MDRAHRSLDRARRRVELRRPVSGQRPQQERYRRQRGVREHRRRYRREHGVARRRFLPERLAERPQLPGRRCARRPDYEYVYRQCQAGGRERRDQVGAERQCDILQLQAAGRIFPLEAERRFCLQRCRGQQRLRPGRGQPGHLAIGLVYAGRVAVPSAMARGLSLRPVELQHVEQQHRQPTDSGRPPPIFRCSPITARRATR